MTGAAGWTTVGLVAAIVLLLSILVLRRVVVGVGRRRLARVAPALDEALIMHLAGLETALPDVGDSSLRRRALRTTALEMLLELRGAERTRLTAVLEATGIVAATASQLGSRSRRTRRRAADALAQYRSAASAEALLAGLDDRDTQVRLACARGLAELGQPESVDRVVEVAAATAVARPGLTAELLLALAAGSPATLADLLVSGPVELRRLAAAVLGELRLADHAEALRGAISSDDDEVAASAARGAGFIGDAEAVEPLLALLGDRRRSWFVRAAAAKALGAIGDPEAVPALEAELAEEVWWVQANAADALALLGPAGRSALERAAASVRTDLRGHAVAALDR
jgi:HEAT repeat protein